MSNPLSNPDTLNLNPDWPDDLTGGKAAMTLDELIDALQSVGIDPGAEVDVLLEDGTNNRAGIQEVRAYNNDKGVLIILAEE